MFKDRETVRVFIVPYAITIIHEDINLPGDIGLMVDPYNGTVSNLGEFLIAGYVNSCKYINTNINISGHNGNQIITVKPGTIAERIKDFYTQLWSDEDEPPLQDLDEFCNIIDNHFQEITKEEYEALITYKLE